MYIEKLARDDIESFIRRRYKLYAVIKEFSRREDGIFIKLNLNDAIYEYSLKDYEVIALNSNAISEKALFEERWIEFMGNNFNYDNNKFFGIKHTNKYTQAREEFLRAKNDGRDC